MSHTGPVFPRRIAHFDLDSFFVAVERVKDPLLRGKPVLVGHPGRRGVVATASYEARVFGCRSAQPMVQALRLCPQAIVVPPDFAAYLDISRLFHAMLGEVTPVVESGGLDEAYADLTGIGMDGMGAREAAEALRTRVRGELGIAVSACIAGSRTAAKVGSDQAKPDGLIEVPVGGDATFLAPLPVRDLPFVGPKFAEGLARAGIRTVGEAAAQDPRWLVAQFGASGAMLADRARGIDPAPVLAGGRERKQISREVTFGEDIADLGSLRAVLREHAERVGGDLRAHGKRARTVTLKLRWQDFTTLSRSHTLGRPVQATSAILDSALALLDEVVQAEGFHPVRLIGLGVTNLVEDVVQLELLAAAGGIMPGRGDAQRQERIDQVLDALRERYGEGSVRRGVPNLRKS